MSAVLHGGALAVQFMFWIKTPFYTWPQWLFYVGQNESTGPGYRVNRYAVNVCGCELSLKITRGQL